MSRDDAALDHDDVYLDRALTACDDALAAGTAPDCLPALEVPEHLAARAQRARACLVRLRRAGPRRPANDGQTPPPLAGLAPLTPTTPPLRLGRFDIVRELGRGGFGIVYLAFDRMLRRQVALKVPRPEVLADADLRHRFVREARLAAALDHPNLVPVLDVHDDGLTCYLVTAYCRGSTLRAWLNERGEPLPSRTAAVLVAALADAVEYVHRRGILHRDIKPGNVLLEPAAPGRSADQSGLAFTPRLTDFGLAKLQEGQSEHHTRTGTLLGTPAYMSPEQARGSSDVGVASDVYSLGATLYELLTGRPPFRAETPVETLRQVLDDDPTPPRQLNGAIDPELETICLTCLRKEPSRRYPSARALADDLARYGQGQPVYAQPPTRRERLVRWSKRRPVAATLLGLAVVLLLGSLGTAVWLDRLARATRVEELLRALQTTEVDRLPALVDELSGFGETGEARVRDLWTTTPVDSPAHFRAAIALVRINSAQSDSEQAAFLVEQSLTANPSDLLVIRDTLQPRRAVLAPGFWRVVRDTNLGPALRFRAACLLAAYDPERERWQEIRDDVTARLVREDLAVMRSWAALLQPVAGFLKGPLWARYRDRMHPEDAGVAAVVLAEQHAQDVATLSDLVQEAEPDQFRHIVPKLLAAPGPSLQALRERWTADRWADGTAGSKQRANVAAAILRLDDRAALWDQLRFGARPDLELRSYLVHRLGPMGVDYREAAQRIAEGKEDSVRRALILALGEYASEQLPQAWKRQQAQWFAALYQEDPDPGIHSACEWLLRRWGMSDAELVERARSARRVPAGKKGWAITRNAHTMAVFQEPDPGQLGSPLTEPGRRPEEVVRPFTPQPFAIATRETTVAQFFEFRPDFKQPPSDKPVTAISFHEAALYCNWLSEREGIPRSEWCYEGPDSKGLTRLVPNHRSRTGYRIPTTEEWEYACRAGAPGRWFFGEAEELLRYYAWYQDNTDGRLVGVAQLKPNEFGLFDTLGNATEWCTHPSDAGPLGEQVFCGGSVWYVARYLRAAAQQRSIADREDELLGFRVARSLPRTR